MWALFLIQNSLLCILHPSSFCHSFNPFKTAFPLMGVNKNQNTKNHILKAHPIPYTRSDVCFDYFLSDFLSKFKLGYDALLCPAHWATPQSNLSPEHLTKCKLDIISTLKKFRSKQLQGYTISNLLKEKTEIQKLNLPYMSRKDQNSCLFLPDRNIKFNICIFHFNVNLHANSGRNLEHEIWEKKNPLKLN